MNEPITGQPLATFTPEVPGLVLPPLDGVVHTLMYDPLPSQCKMDYEGDGRYESLRHRTDWNELNQKGLVDYQW